MTGLVYGVAYLVLGVMLTIVFVKLFKLLNQPVMTTSFKEFFDSRSRLICLATVFVATYFLRACFSLLLGYFQIIIPSALARWELYFMVTTVLEIPCMFMLYATHYRSFKEKPDKLSVSLNLNDE